MRRFTNEYSYHSYLPFMEIEFLPSPLVISLLDHWRLGMEEESPHR